MNDAVQPIPADEWCFLSGRVSAMEGRLIRNDFMQRMSYGDSLDDLFLSISDTNYSDAFPIIEKLYEADSIISDSYVQRLDEIARYSPRPEVVGMFLVEFDFWNFKGYLKNTLAGMDVEYGDHGSVSDENWERVYNDLKTPLPAFWYRAAELIRENIDEDQPQFIPQVVDYVLDSEYLIQQVRTARLIGYPLIIKWAEKLKVIKGIEIIWRSRSSEQDLDTFRRLFLRDELNESLLHELTDLPLEEWPDRLRSTFLEPIVDEVFAGGRGDPTTFSRLGEDMLLDSVRPAKFKAYGPDRVFGYLVALRSEIYNLRVILGGKVNKISSELLQARVRQQYV